MHASVYAATHPPRSSGGARLFGWHLGPQRTPPSFSQTSTPKPVKNRGRRTAFDDGPVTEYTSMTMESLKAHVKNGRLLLDEPTDLPEGEVIEPMPVNDVLANGGDGLDDEERERLHDSLREGIRQMKAGETIDAADAMAELRAHR